MAMIAAAAVDVREAAPPEVEPPSPLLVEQHVIIDARGRWLEATESRYCTDRCALDVRFDVDGGDQRR